MFATFGSFPEVQAEQLRHVQNDYLIPAVSTAKQLGFKSELGLALAFDIHVQNGGIKNTALGSIQQQSAAGISASDLRRIARECRGRFLAAGVHGRRAESKAHHCHRAGRGPRAQFRPGKLGAFRRISCGRTSLKPLWLSGTNTEIEA
jgi:hypothetical protein